MIIDPDLKLIIQWIRRIWFLFSDRKTKSYGRRQVILDKLGGHSRSFHLGWSSLISGYKQLPSARLDTRERQLQLALPCVKPCREGLHSWGVWAFWPNRPGTGYAQRGVPDNGSVPRPDYGSYWSNPIALLSTDKSKWTLASLWG